MANFGNHKISHEQISCLSFWFYCTTKQYVTNMDQICCWSAKSFFLVKHTKIKIQVCDHPIHALIGLFGTSYHMFVWKHNIMVSSLYLHIYKDGYKILLYHCKRGTKRHYLSLVLGMPIARIDFGEVWAPKSVYLFGRKNFLNLTNLNPSTKTPFLKLEVTLFVDVTHPGCKLGFKGLI